MRIRSVQVQVQVQGQGQAQVPLMRRRPGWPVSRALRLSVRRSSELEGDSDDLRTLSRGIEGAGGAGARGAGGAGREEVDAG